MIGPVRRRKAFRLGIVLLALSALVSVVALAFDQPQQLSELIVAANVATGPRLRKLLVGRVTPFAGSTVKPPAQVPAKPGWYNDPTGAYTHQAYWDGNQWTGAVRPGVPNGETENSKPGWAAIVSLASGIGAFAASLPFWLVLLVVVAVRMRGRSFSSTSLHEGVMGFLVSEGVIVFLLGATSILGLLALVAGWIAAGTRKRFASDHRIGRIGMILGGVGAGSTWIILAFFVASLFGLT